MSLWSYIHFFDSAELKGNYQGDSSNVIDIIENNEREIGSFSEAENDLIKGSGFIEEEGSVGNIFDLMRYEIENGRAEGKDEDLTKIVEYCENLSMNNDSKRIGYSEYEPFNGFLFAEEVADLAKRLNFVKFEKSHVEEFRQTILGILERAIGQNLGIYIMLF